MIADYHDNMFYIPIYHFYVRDWTNKKQKLLKLYESVYCDLKTSNTVITNYHQDNEKLVCDLGEVFCEEIQEFCKKVERKVYMSCGWFEESVYQSYHSVHNHGSKGYSSVCYINFNQEKHKSTRFMAPFPNFFDGNSLIYVPQCSEGSIIFFPSYIPHYTEPNLSDENRLIVSFNLLETE